MFIPSENLCDWSLTGTTQKTYSNVIDLTNSLNLDGSDDSQVINDAIGTADPESTILLPEGNITTNNAIQIFDKAIIIQGVSPQKTKINYTGLGTQIIKAFKFTWQGNTWIPIVSQLNKGMDTMILDTVEPFWVGATIVVSQDNDRTEGITAQGSNAFATWLSPFENDGNHIQNQIVEITAINGKQITFTPPIVWSLKRTLNPVVRMKSFTSGVGVENLAVIGTNTERNSKTFGNIEFSLTKDSWITNCYSRNSGGGHFTLWDSFRCSVSNGWMAHGTESISEINGLPDGSDSGRNYGMWLFGTNSSHRIENLICEDHRHSLIYEGPASFNVFGYCYTIHSVSDFDRNWQTPDIDGHGAYGHHNLYEGCDVANYTQDRILGPSGYNTVFRCRIHGTSKGSIQPEQNLVAVMIDGHSDLGGIGNYNHAVVGCIIGEPGTTGIRFTDWNNFSHRTPTAYKLGSAFGSASGLADPRVAQTTHLHMNYDYHTDSLLIKDGWDIILPDSLYLTAKPSWYVGAVWPPVISNGIAKSSDIPAKLRFENGGVVRTLGLEDKIVGDTPDGLILVNSVILAAQVASFIYERTNTGKGKNRTRIIDELKLNPREQTQFDNIISAHDRKPTPFEKIQYLNYIQSQSLLLEHGDITKQEWLDSLETS